MFRIAVRAAARAFGIHPDGVLGPMLLVRPSDFESPAANGSHALDRSRLGMKPKLAALAAGSKVNHS